MATIYTIGHSTRTFDELLAALKAHGVGTLVDIRAFPMSRRLPHFNRESLEQELPKHDVAYVWMKELGGRRNKIRDDSPNTGLRNHSFRNYADYMLTDEFAAGIDRLVGIAEKDSSLSGETADTSQLLGMTRQKGSASVGMEEQQKNAEDGMTKGGKSLANTAIMCAERVYFQCHRMLVSDYLTANGHTVLHIDDDKRSPRIHKLMAEARLVDGKVIYNAQQLF
jgi:uncharacterized protein (DUF488 family)